METTAERSAAVQELIAATDTKPADVQKAALEAMAAPIPAPSGADVGWLWKVLVVGVLVLIGIAIIGVLIAVLDGDVKTEGDKALIIFTPLVTGLFGLFVPSPVANNG